LVKRKVELVRTLHDVAFANPGEVVKLAPIGPTGMKTAVFCFDPNLVLEVVRELDPARSDTAAPFAHTHAPADPYVYRLQHELFFSMHETNNASPLGKEELALELLRGVVRAAYKVRGTRPRRAESPAHRRHRDAVQNAIECLSLRFAERLSLSEIASVTGLSMPYFCRIFRRIAGSTVHAYLTRLRLRSAMSQLVDATSMTQLALAHGFCSSAHFGSAFRREFGVPPTTLRDSLLQTGLRRESDSVRSCHVAKRARF
jgi:AraC-like DNA-binding protein